MDRLAGKVAVVTGASAGIGAALVERLVEDGLKVVGIARRKERLDELASKLVDKKGTFTGVKADMTKEDDILEAFKWITENVGPIQILVNNAGLSRMTSIVDGDASEWRKILDTNVLGLAIATREAIKSMRDNDIDGHILNVNSVAGHFVPPLPFQNVYPASKFAVTALTETLRKDLVQLKSKIRVSSVSPGCVDTEIFEVNGFLTDSEVIRLLSIAPKLSPADVADAIAYVLYVPPHVQISELIIRPTGEFV